MDDHHSVCSLPWTAVDRHQGVYRPCCLVQGPQWRPHRSLEKYWHSSELRDLRQNLLAGVRDPACQRCWSQEQQGLQSLRQSVMRDPDRRIFDPHHAKIQQVKLLTGRHCNLACMMCFPTVSSSYADLWRDQMPWSLPQAKQQVMTYDTDIDVFIRENHKDITHIEALGGEPMFSKDFLALLQYLRDVGASQRITLYIITNGTILTQNQICLLRSFRKVVFCVSLDGVGAVNEYQRWPSKWAQIEKNLEIMQRDFDITVLCTITAVNIIYVDQLESYCQARDLVLGNYGIVMHWPQLHPRNLPESLHARVPEKLRYLLSGPNDTESLLSFVSTWDQRRGIRIEDYLPEWQWIKSCRASP